MRSFGAPKAQIEISEYSAYLIDFTTLNWKLMTSSISFVRDSEKAALVC